MTITVFKNEHKVAQEPVLFQHYLCRPVNFPLYLRVLFVVYLLTDLLLWTLQNVA